MSLLFAAIGWLQARPWNEYKATFLNTIFPETRLEIVLPRDRGLFTAIVWIAGEQFVLENEGVSLICEFSRLVIESWLACFGFYSCRSRISNGMVVVVA
jgi:hypothetical protein